ncbi:carbamate kinase [Vagococcus elongatus]|uniref:Carbamate kinase n=1 Tax=Vagococcus elongatus TaxID=180344 RepID=A0A430AHQ8_9ENTE|nr:carbamate kinase [Vagococcus elongatus]RSU07632.1 carbamate kinase [Vagococcus elongatus]
MDKDVIVIALGGNAILTEDPSAQGQQKTLAKSVKYLVDLIQQGYRLVITHGNGPQIGNLLLQHIASDSKTNPAFPLDSLVAMTEGCIGYWIQNLLQNEIHQHNLNTNVVSLITQVVVDEKDSAFKNPTKPIGPFIMEKQAKEKMKNSTDIYKEDAGRGWRKVVSSPKAIRIKEIYSIKALLNQDQVVIAVGGGGIPVVEDKQSNFYGVEAVIDKDQASEKLAEQLKAKKFIILTEVDYVYLNFNQPNQRKLEQITTEQAKQFIDEGQFAAGSMLPKIEAAIEFVENNPEGEAAITSLENLGKLLNKQAGTIIKKNKNFIS